MIKLAVVTDMHVGHQGGLHHPNNIYYDRSSKTYSVAKECAHEFSSWATSIGKVDYLINVGDTIDGDGHKSGGVENNTTDRLEQVEHATKILKQIKFKKYFSVYGTPYHVGNSENFEAIIAKELKGEIHDQLHLEIGGVRIFVRHEGPGSTYEHSRPAAIGRMKHFQDAWSSLFEMEKADLIMFGHRHTYCMTRFPNGNRMFTGISLPALQSVHGNRFGARRCNGTVHWGALLIEIDPATQKIYIDDSFVRHVNSVTPEWRKV